MPKNVISITKLSALLTAAILAGGCEATKSETPTSPNIAGPIAGVGISAPAVRSPINGAEVVNSEPLRLVFGNSTTNGVRPLYYVLEVATDNSFSQRVYFNPKVLPFEGDQTSVVVEAQLDPEKAYFWRVKAEDGANSSDYSEIANFNLVVPVVIDPPHPVGPGGGETVSSRTPQLRVNNGSVQGRAGEVFYLFVVSTDPGFGSLIWSGTTGMNGSGTTTITTGDLPANSTIYWHAYGSNGVVSSRSSAVLSFRTPAAPAPAPGPGGGGGNSSSWSTEQWRVWFFDLVARRGYPNATVDAMGAMRGELVSMGVDWQNGWRGDYRPRIFLPVPGCPPPYLSSAPECSYSRPVDVGENGLGRPWTWVPR